MRRITFRLLGFAVLLLLACAALIGRPALAQVTDQPITSWPTDWTGVVSVVSVNDKTGCVAGWAPAIDKYSERRLQLALVDGARLTGAGQANVSAGISATSPAQLAAARNVNVHGIDPTTGVRVIDAVARPCYDKLQAPPPPWIVSPISSGKRATYLLNADGTRGKQVGYALLTITGDSGNTGPNWCECSAARSKETTSSTYCKPAMWMPSASAVSPDAVVVTLCRTGPS